MPKPQRLLRDNVEKQVSIRSPIPDKPANVSGLPPIALQINLISLEPRVTINAIVD